MTIQKQFRAMLQTDGPNSQATFIAIPFDVPKTFGSRARVRVCGTLDGFPFRSSIFPYGGVHYLIVNQTVRAGAKVKAGDSVTIVMERDGKPRIVRPPADLARALKANPTAQAAWQRASYTRRKELADVITAAKKPETRARRLVKAIAELVAQQK